jgi:hypothetical protein
MLGRELGEDRRKRYCYERYDQDEKEAAPEDPFGNLATGYSGTVHFTSSDSQAVRPADTTLTSGTGNLTASTVAFSTSALDVPGSPHAITAVYGSDANFAASTSGAIAQTVGAAVSGDGDAYRYLADSMERYATVLRARQKFAGIQDATPGLIVIVTNDFQRR